MSSLHEVVSTWKVSSDTVQKFEVWLYSPDRGWKPTDPVDDAFFTLSEEDLVQAGLTTLKERRQILAKIKAAAASKQHVKDASSPKGASTSLHTVALSSSKNPLRSTFPNITASYPGKIAGPMHSFAGCGDPVPSFNGDVIDLILEHIFSRVLESNATFVNTGKEAYYTLAWSPMLVAIMQLSADNPISVKDPDDVHVADSLHLDSSRAHEDPVLYTAALAHEANIYAEGYARGWIEFQVQMQNGHGIQYTAGCIELGLDLTNPTKFQAKVQQAEKEAFAIWVMNANEGVYEPVYVILSDGFDIVRITYTGSNTPGSAAPYIPRMRASKVQGKLTASDCYRLYDQFFEPHKRSGQALSFILDSFWPKASRDVTAEVLKARLDRVTAENKKRTINLLKQAAGKRSREDDAAVMQEAVVQ